MHYFFVSEWVLWMVELIYCTPWPTGLAGQPENLIEGSGDCTKKVLVPSSLMFLRPN